jgi:DNA polymerase (family 10)
VSVEREDGTTAGKLPDGLTAELRAVRREEHARALVETTGGPGHVARLAALAGGHLPDAATEEEVYRSLGLAFVPPEMREDVGEVDLARAGRLPSLVTERDVRGLIHCHTVWSDGRHTVEEMAAEADLRGFEYLAITDHSASAFYAKGLDLDRLRAQWEEIDRVQEGCRVRLLKGTESDIQADGALDWPDEILERLDLVIASIHTHLRMDPARMTARIERAMAAPPFKVWGHPLARILLRREPLACDLSHVLDVVARSPAAIEINGDPHRLDLAPEHVREARSRGIPIVISTDAHSRRSMGYLRWGVTMARRAGLEARDVLNTLDAPSFQDRVRPT